MSLLTTASLIAVWCTLEVANSHLMIPSPMGTQYQDTGSYPVNAGYQLSNSTLPGNQDGDGDQKDGKNPYRMVYIEKDQFRCEECDDKGNIRGNMTYLDEKQNSIRTVKYETKDIPLELKAQESGAQDAYQQPFIQGQQLQPLQGQQMVQSLIQGQQLQNLQPQLAYNGQPMQAQGQSYQGNLAAFNPLIHQQNPIAPQLQGSLIAPALPSQRAPAAVQAPINFATNPYANIPSPSSPFALEKSLSESVLPGLFGPRATETRASSSNNQGLGGLTNAGGYPLSAMEALAAEAIRNLQPQPVQPAIPTQPVQPIQPHGFSYDKFGNLARNFNFMNTNGNDDKPQGPSTLSSQWYNQPLFSATGTGMAFNREPSGAYRYELKTPDINRKESADDKNNVIGSYSYKDSNGGTQLLKYNNVGAREHSNPPSVMPLILVPAQQPGGQQVPFTLVAPGNSPLLTTHGDAVDKTVSKDADPAKTLETAMTDSMLQKLAKQIAANMGSSEKEGTISQPATEAEQLPEAR